MFPRLRYCLPVIQHHSSTLYTQYSRTSIIRISIIRTLGYLNAILNLKFQKQFDFLQNQVTNEMSV